jgi:hypothetical protein
MHYESPVMSVGKYAGKRVDQLPNSYLRWMMTQGFPKNILEAAEQKLKKSDFADIFLAVSRHAIDMYSKRFLFRWMKKENIRGEEGDGIATHVAKEADIAWTKGVDVSKRRYIGDGIIKEYDGLLWVFKVNPEFPDYKDVVTVMDASE